MFSEDKKMIFIYIVINMIALRTTFTIGLSYNENGFPKQLIIASHRYYTLETDDPVGFVGSEFVFYISFRDELYKSVEPLFLIRFFDSSSKMRVITCYTSLINAATNVTRTYKNVHVFAVSLEMHGLFRIIALPQRIVEGRIYEVQVTDDNGTVENIHGISINVKVISPDETDKIHCDSVGQFFVDKYSSNFSYTPRTIALNVEEWTKISVAQHACASWKGLRPKWSFEKVFHARYTHKYLSQCMNLFYFREINISDHASKILQISLPGPSRESKFIIQPSTFPPGYYRICNTVSNNTNTVKRCTFLVFYMFFKKDTIEAKSAVRIWMSPELEEFTWPLRDLILNVTEYYSIFAVYDTLFYGHLNYSFQWTCRGHSLCQRLRTGLEIYDPMINYLEIELNEKGTTLFIPANYMVLGAQITVKFTATYQHPIVEDFIVSGTVERIIVFDSLSHGIFSIRCFRNCGNLVTPELGLLIGLECSDCRITRANDPQITWSIPDLKNARMEGQNTYYLLVYDFGSNLPETFHVRVTVDYISSRGAIERINMTKLFRLSGHHKSFEVPKNYFKEGNVTVQPGDLVANFIRYEVILDVFFAAVKKSFTIPFVLTVFQSYWDVAPLSNIYEYTLLRTLWAPVDICVVYFQPNAINDVKEVIVSYSTGGFSNMYDSDDVFAVEEINPLIGLDEAIEQLLWYANEDQSFVVDDQTYLLAISLAIKVAAVKYYNDTYESGDITSLNETGIPNLANVSNACFQADMSSEPDLQNGVELSHVVELILNAMLSHDGKVLTYSNIDVYLVSLLRMLTIRKYSSVILEKAIAVLANAHALHKTIRNDPHSEENLLSLKLGALYAIKIYFLELRKEYAHCSKNTKYVSVIVENTFEIIRDIPSRQEKRFPHHVINSDESKYVALGFWVDPSLRDEDLILEFNFLKLIIHIEGLKNVSLLDYAMDTLINVATYSSLTSILPATSSGHQPRAPMLHISICKKQQTQQPFSIHSAGIYTIMYKFNYMSQEEDNKKVSLAIYSGGNGYKNIKDSDCYFFKVRASPRYASILTFKLNNSDIILGIRLELSNKLSAGIKVINSDQIILPQQTVNNQNCDGHIINPYSIFLPMVTLRQVFEMKGRLEYYIILKILPNQKYRNDSTSHIPSDIREIKYELINVSCVQATCLQYYNDKLTTDDCQVSSCTDSESSNIYCSCDRGITFSADAEQCDTRMFDIERKILDDEYIYQKNYMIPSVIIFLWMLFFTLFVVARREDKHETLMGKTLALEGVFSPINSKHYLVCFVTGFGHGCGTTSVPYMTIIGSKRVSPRYKLKTEQSVFVSGSEIWLLVSVPDDLGKMKQIILSLQSKNKKLSSWFVRELYIRQISSLHEWRCSFNAWIPDNSNFDFPFIANDVTKDPESGKAALASIFLRLLRNQHPVVGIKYNIPGSSFTKAQHVIFCFYSVLIIMWICLQAHKLPSPKLASDYIVSQRFSLELEFYNRSAFCALISTIPIYIVGRLLECAQPIDTRNVEWHKMIKEPIHQPFYMSTEYRNLHKLSDAADTNVSETKWVFTESAVDMPRYSQQLREERLMLTKNRLRMINSKRKSIAPSVDTVERCPIIIDLIVTCLNMAFQLPALIYLAVISIIIVSISYYIFALGLYFNTASSIEYIYIVCVTVIVLVVVVYPLFLVVMACVHRVMFVCINSYYYGVRQESVIRIQKIFAVLPAIQDTVNLNIVRTRTKTLGSLEDQSIPDRIVVHSHAWCKQIVRKRAIREKRVPYNHFQNIIFIVVVLAIVSLETGSVHNRFLQTKFLSKSLGLHIITQQPHITLTTEEFWNHLIKMFTTINTWKSNTSTIVMHIMTAIRVRQVRVKPYKGNCVKDYPDLIYPRCLFDIESSVIETRTFANTWDLPVLEEYSVLGPYIYIKADHSEDIITPTHNYRGGGYDLLLARSKNSFDILNYLRENKWVDEYTRAVAVSVNFINIDSGLSTIIEHVYEFTMAGMFMHTSDINTFPIRFSEKHEVGLSCLVVLFAMMAMYFLTSEIKSCYEHGLLSHFITSHSWLLLAECCFSIAILLIHLWLWMHKKWKLSQVHDASLRGKSEADFISFKTISLRTGYLILFSCLMVVTCLIKVLRKIRDYVLMRTFIHMIPTATKTILMPVICIIAFGFLGCLLFQSVLMHYNSVTKAITTVTVLLLETSVVVPTVESFSVIGQLYITSLYVVMLYLVLNYYIVLLNESYSEIKRQRRVLTK